MKIAITPHSIAPSAIAATKATLSMSPITNMSDELDDGRIIGETANYEMAMFMIVRQGYAKSVERIEQ